MSNTRTPWQDWAGIMRHYTSALVTGPQRSGTQLVSRILCAETGLPYVDHLRCRPTAKGIHMLICGDPMVAHQPTLHGITPYLENGHVAVFVVFRDIADIKASERRIGWKGERRELLNLGVPSGSAMHKMVRQERWADRLAWVYAVQYGAMQSHALWVPANVRRRGRWGAKSWEVAK